MKKLRVNINVGNFLEKLGKQTFWVCYEPTEHVHVPKSLGDRKGKCSLILLPSNANSISYVSGLCNTPNVHDYRCISAVFCITDTTGDVIYLTHSSRSQL